MTKYNKGTFGNGVEINAQVVNGLCPFCKTNSLLVSIHKAIFRCMHCGSDIEQKINGKISYIPHINSSKDVKLELNPDG